MSYELIEKLASAYDKAREVLRTRIQELEAEITKLKRRRRPGLKSATDSMAQAKSELMAAIDNHRQLFKSPKTKVFSGTKVGLQKSKGSLKYDKAAVVSAIKKKLPEKADLLIRTEEVPVADALKQLSAAELQRIGVTVIPGTDRVIIKTQEGEIDKLIDAWLADLDEEDAA